jgi:hypothetical protein
MNAIHSLSPCKYALLADFWNAATILGGWLEYLEHTWKLIA